MLRKLGHKIGLMLTAAVMMLIPPSVSAQAPALAFPLPDTFAFHGFGWVEVNDLVTFPLGIDFNGSGSVDLAAHSLNLTAETTTEQSDGSQSTAAGELRLLSNTLYVNLGGGWQAIENAGDYASQILSLSALAIDPAALSEWDITGIDGISAILSALLSADPSAYLTVEKVDDATVDNVPVVRWHSLIDLPAFMRTDAFVDAVYAFAQAQGNALVIYSRDELAPIVRDNAALYEGSTVEVDTYIGVQDGLVHRLKVHVSLLVKPQTLDYPDPPFTVSLFWDVTFSQLGQPQTIAAPDDAEIVTELELPGTPSAGMSDGSTTSTIYFGGIGEGETYQQMVDLKAGDRVSVIARAWDLDLDTNLSLTAPDGTVIAENDDAEEAVFAVDGLNSYIPPTLIDADGTYTVEVGDYNGSGGPFMLTITVQP